MIKLYSKYQIHHEWRKSFWIRYNLGDNKVRILKMTVTVWFVLSTYNWKFYNEYYIKHYIKLKRHFFLKMTQIIFKFLKSIWFFVSTQEYSSSSLKCIYLLVCIGVPWHVCVRSEDNFQLVLSSHHVGSRTQTQISDLQAGRQVHFLMSHLASSGDFGGISRDSRVGELVKDLSVSLAPVW